MKKLRLKNVGLSLILLSCALPALGQQNQQTNNNSQAPQPNQSVPPPPVVMTDAQQMAANAAAARQAGQIPPTDAQAAINKMTATCKIIDPPPNQPVLTAASDSSATSPACDPSSLTRRRTDADVAQDFVMDSLTEEITGVPTSAESAYQKGATDLGSAALNAAANKMDSDFLAKAAGFVESDAFSGFLGVSLQNSQAGYGPAFDAMTPEQYQAYQENQFQQLQSNFFSQNPGSFCLMNPSDPRCGGQGLATAQSDAGYAAACTRLQNAISQYNTGTQSAQVNAVLQWCQQYGQGTGPAPLSAGGSSGSTQQGRTTTTAPPPPKKPMSPSCGHPGCTAP